jgi:hypothetical protein
MPYQTGLPAALSKRGLKVETVAGWQTRGGSGLTPKGALCHWTAGPRNSTTRPSLNICINGRTGLPGPLCNIYLARDGVAVVVAAGVSNHGGVGTWRGQSGNSKFFGTEAECGGDADWTPAQRAAYPKLNAAYCDLGGFGPEMIAGHHEYATPAGRKIDIRDWPMSAMRSQVAAILANPTREVPDLDATEKKQLSEVHQMLTGRYGPGGRNMGDMLVELMNRQEGYGRRIENAEARVIALEAAVATLAEGSDITADEIEDAVAKALRENVVRVDVDVTGPPSA